MGIVRTTEYHLSLDMAKELSMVENNAKGREARRYFIAMEKKALGAPEFSQPAVETISPIQYHNLRVMVRSIGNNFHRKSAWEHWAWKHVRALSNGEVAAKLPATMYDQAVNVLKALEVEASIYIAKLYDTETEFLRQDRSALVNRVQMSLPLAPV